jgi:hypothetical protein
VLLRDPHVEAEGILDPEIARPPGTRLQLLDHAARPRRDRVHATDIRDRENYLDAVASLRGPRKATEVRMSAYCRGPAPETEDRLAAAQHEIAVVGDGGLVAHDAKAETSVEAFRESEVGHM